MTEGKERIPMGANDQDFLWGVASSGYQCEGGFNGPGQPQNNWAPAELSDDVMRTGSATNFWSRYEEDFERCRAMGLNAFRLSIEWARVQPVTSAMQDGVPDFDLEAIDGYADRIAACRTFGLEPVVTLHHFTHPLWLGSDAWLDDETPEHFGRFVRECCTRINHRLGEVHKQPPVRWYVTLNEPNMLVLNTYLNRQFPAYGPLGLATGVSAYNRLLAAHVRAYNIIHDLYEEQKWASPMVTMNTFCSDAYWSEKMLLDLLFSRERGISRAGIKDYLQNGAKELRREMHKANLPFHTDFFVWIGRFVSLVADWMAPRHATGHTFSFFLDELDRSKRSRVMDYLGLDYYDPFTGHLFRPPSFHDLEFKNKSLTGHMMAGLSRKWWDWHVLPQGLHFFSSYYASEFHLGVLIAENGMALRCKWDNTLKSPRRDKVTRSEFLRAHVGEVQRLRADGVPMLGYLHWSITDNYEWGSYTPRFGLFSIDYQDNARRKVEDPFGDRPSETYAKLVADARAGR